MEFTRLNIQGLQGAAKISSGANITLKEKDRAFYLAFSLTAASKTVTLDLPEDAVCVVVNEGSNAFTLKNVSGDSGQSVAASNAYLVHASRTANATTLLLIAAPAISNA